MRRHLLALACLAALTQAASAQSRWRTEAVPYYTPPAFMQGQLNGWYRPRAQAFAQTASTLATQVQAQCDGAPAAASRRAWTDALLAWDRLSAVAVGPLVERRSARRIDFAPTRPELIARAIERAPKDAAEMETIGSAAKGLPALEHLLWPAAPKDAACRYAVQVAADIAREAQALAAAFEARATAEPDDAQTVTAMNEAVNQWLGGIEQLRLQGLERPLAEARSRGTAPHFGRDASGASAAERGARWQALRALAVHDGQDAPAAEGALVPLEPYLRGKGLNPLADRLLAAVRRADRDLNAAVGNSAGPVRTAARSLATLRTLVEAEVAPALDIRLGFSDADGD